MRIESNGAGPWDMEREVVAMLRIKGGREEKGKRTGFGAHRVTHQVIWEWRWRKVRDARMRVIRCANRSYALTIGGIDLVFHVVKYYLIISAPRSYPACRS